MQNKKKLYLLVLGCVAMLLAVAALAFYLTRGEISKDWDKRVLDNTNEKLVENENNSLGYFGSEGMLYNDNMNIPSGADLYKATSVKISYLATKVFIGKPAQTVVGVADNAQVSGWFDENSREGFVSLTVSLEDFRTDNQKRDEDVVKLIGTDSSIKVEGRISNIPEFSATANIVVPMEFTIAQASREVPLNATITKNADGNILISGDGTLTLSDFGITPPSIANVYEVSDDIQVKFELVAEKQEK